MLLPELRDRSYALVSRMKKVITSVLAFGVLCVLAFSSLFALEPEQSVPEAHAQLCTIEDALAWYTFENGSGTTVTDITGNDHDGTLINTEEGDWTTGQLGLGVNFDGVDEYMRIPHKEDLQITDGKIEFWFKLDSLGEEQVFFAKDHTGFKDGGHITFFYDTDFSGNLPQPKPGSLGVRMQDLSTSYVIHSDLDLEIEAGRWYYWEFWFGAEGMHMEIDNDPQADTDPYTGGIETNQEDILVAAGNFFNPDEPVKAYADVTIDNLIINKIEYTGCVCPDDWWDTNWGARRQLAFQNLDLDEDLSNFPVLIKLNSSRIDYAKVQNAGQDLRFIDSNAQTVLDYEIESWNESGDSYVWVRIPQVDRLSDDDFIWVYYDNESAPDGQNKTGVWNSNYRMVMHMHEQSGHHLDSSAYGNHAHITTVTNQGQEGGQINGASLFDGFDDVIEVPASTSLNNDTFTMETWFKANSAGQEGSGRIFDKMRDDDDFVLYANDERRIIFVGRRWSGKTGVWRTDINAIEYGENYYLVVDYDHDSTSSDPRLFLNGQEVTLTETRTPTGSRLSSNAGLIIANDKQGTRTFDGFFDEMRYADKKYSLGWIQKQYSSMSDTFINYGSEELLNDDCVGGGEPLPDLVPINLSADQTTIELGQSVLISAQGRNQGSADAATSDGRFCANNPDCLNSTVGRIGTDQTLGPLPIDAISGLINPGLWTPDATGTYEITFCVDSGKVVPESDEANNCTQTGALTIEVIDPPAFCDTNASGTNQLIGCLWNGNNFFSLEGPAPDGPVLSFPAPLSATALDFDWGNGSPDEPTVGNDGFSAVWKGSFFFQPGTYTFTGGSDDGIRVRMNGVTQIDEWRNRNYEEQSYEHTFDSQTNVDFVIDYYEDTGSARVKFYWSKNADPVPLPNLKAKNLDSTTGSHSITVGESLTFKGEIHNEGDGDAGSSTARFCVGVNSQTECFAATGDNLLSDHATAAIPSGGVPVTIDPSASYTFNTVGTFPVMLCADAATEVGESNENDNCTATLSVTVSEAPQPNLKAIDLVSNGGTTIEVGETIDFEGKIWNDGNDNAETSQARFCVNAGSQEECFAADASSPNHISQHDTIFLVPSNKDTITSGSWTPTAVGAYPIMLCADVEHDVPNESNENDNCTTAGALTIAVVDSSAPDLTIASVTWPTTVDIYTDISAPFTIENIGTATAQAGYFNDIWNNADGTNLYTDGGAPTLLDPGFTYEPASPVLAAQLTENLCSLTVYATTDSNDDVPNELNENNNRHPATGAHAITANPAGSPGIPTFSNVGSPETGIRIQWNQNVPSQSGFDIYRCEVGTADCGDNPQEGQRIFSDLPRDYYYKDDEGLSCGTTYRYWVEANGCTENLSPFAEYTTDACEVFEPNLKAKDLVSNGGTTINVGESITFTGVIWNEGNADAFASQGRFCVDTGSQTECFAADASSPNHISQHDTIFLIPGNEDSLTSGNWTPTAEGSYPIMLCADVEDHVPNESNENDNCTPAGGLVIEVVQPNLKAIHLDSISGVRSITIGESLTFEGDIHNDGTGDAEPSTSRFCVNTTSQADCQTATALNGKLISDHATIGVLSGETTTVSPSASYTFSSIGTFPVMLCADAATEVGESNEIDNCDTIDITVSELQQPNLIATGLISNGGTTIELGTSVDFTGFIQNSGNETALASTARFCVNTGSQEECFAAVPGNNEHISQHTTGSLGLGQSEEETSELWTPTATGDYPIKLCADVLNEEPNESDEDDNCTPAGALTMTVVPVPNPDLTASDLVANGDTEILLGDSLTFMGNINNIHDGDADPSTARFCVNTGNQTECFAATAAAGTLISNEPVGALNGGGTTSESVTSDAWTPEDTGEYPIMLCADVDNDVPNEEDEFNNCTDDGALTITVTAPDLTIPGIAWPGVFKIYENINFHSFLIDNIGGDAAPAGYFNDIWNAADGTNVWTDSGNGPALAAGANGSISDITLAPQLTENLCELDIYATTNQPPADFFTESNEGNNRFPTSGSHTITALPAGDPGAPTFSNVTEDSLRVSWNENVESHSGFNVYRCEVGSADCGTSPQESQLVYGDLPRDFYYKDDAGLSCGTTYRYWVQANGCTETLGSFADIATAVCPQPNLKAKNLDSTTGSHSITVGESLTFKGEIHNEGDGDAGSSTARFCVGVNSQTECFAATGDNLLSDHATAAIPSGGVPVTIDPSASYTFNTVGTFPVMLCADAATEVGESNENDNCTATLSVTVSEAPQPNLKAIDLVSNGGTTIELGASIDFSGTIQNSGNETALASTARFCVNTGSQAECFAAAPGNADHISQHGTNTLGVGASEGKTSALWTPNSTGSYPIKLCADVLDEEPNESNENDNCTAEGALTITVIEPSKPDLTASNLEADGETTIVLGDSVTFTGEINNIDSGDAGPTTARFCVNTGSQTECFGAAAGDIVSDESIVALAGNTSVQVGSDTWTPTETGEYPIMLCADVFDVVQNETDEFNNCTADGALTMTVTAPDLTVSNPDYVVQSLCRLQPQSLLSTVSNIGDGPSSGDITVAYKQDASTLCEGTSGVVIGANSSLTNYLCEFTPTVAGEMVISATVSGGNDSNLGNNDSSGTLTLDIIDIPGEVQNLRVANKATRSIDWEWDSAGAGATYDFQTSNTGNVGTFVTIASGLSGTSVTQFIDQDGNDLVPGRQYFGRVIAHNACGSSTSSANATYTFTEEAINLAGAGQCSGILWSWEHNENDPGLTEYQVRTGPFSSGWITGTSWDQPVAASANPVSGWITSRNQLGEESAEVGPVVASVLEVPSGGVTGLGETAVSKTSITWGWSPVAGATSYKIVIDGLIDAGTVTDTSFHYADLFCDTEYEITVTPTNTCGESTSVSDSAQTTSCIDSEPNLKIENIPTIAGGACIDDQQTISATVVNRGSASVTNSTFSTRFQFAGATLCEDENANVSLGIGGTSSFSCTFTPSNASMSIVAQADRSDDSQKNNKVSESNENDNDSPLVSKTFQTAPGAATWANPTFTNVQTDAVTINWNTVTGADTYSLYTCARSISDVACDPTTLLTTQAGTSFTHAVTANTVYDYKVVTNGICGNTDSTHVTFGADLIVATYTIPSSISVNDQVNFTTQIENIGNAHAFSPAFKTQVFIKEPGASSFGSVATNVRTLGAGERSGTITFEQWTAKKTGTHEFDICIDTEEGINEYNEDNNGRDQLDCFASPVSFEVSSSLSIGSDSESELPWWRRWFRF